MFSNVRNYSRRIDDVLDNSIIALEHLISFQRLTVDSVVMARLDFKPALQVRRDSRVFYDVLEYSELFWKDR